MATFDYTSSGGVSIVGCVDINTTYNLITEYDIGDKVYLKHRARLGKLEYVYIKKINVINRLDYNYQDTDNRIWLENEFVLLEEAQSIVESFNARRSASYVRYLRNCNSKIS